MKTSKRLALGLLAAASSIALLAGCASGGPGGDSAAGDGTFVIAIGTNPANLNSAVTTDNSIGFIGDAIYERLVLLSADFSIAPRLAESWESNEDATQYTFNLRKDVTWHDGEPFTSADVKYNIEEVLPLHSLGPKITNVLKSVETPDEHTVVINLTEPFGAVVEAMTTFFMLPAHLYEGTDIVTNEYNMTPVGTGPYKFDKFNTGDSVEVSQYDGYWGEQGDAKRVIFKVLPDDSSRTLALQSGDIDFIPETFLDLAQRSVLEGDDKFLVFEAGTMPQQMLMYINSKNEILQDFNVRSALFRAIDREAISSKVYLDTATPAKAPVANQVGWAIDPSIDFTKQFAYDPVEAGKMLDAAGYPAGSDGKRFDIRLSYITGLPTFAGSAQQVKANLEEIGVGVTLEAQDINVYIEETFTKSDFDLSVIELAAYADPSLGSARAYQCNPNRIPFTSASQLCDDAMDAAWKAAGQSSDRAERLAAFTEAQKRVAETLGAAPLASAYSIGAGRADRWDGLGEYANAFEGRVWSALKQK